MRVIEDCDASALPLEELLAEGVPVLLKGVARDWDLVAAGRHSNAEAMAYLRRFDAGKPVRYSHGEPAIGGRPFYTEDFAALNFEVKRGDLSQVLGEIEAHFEDPMAPTYYIASLLVSSALPGFARKNSLPMAACGLDAPASIWIGNRVVASCHYDAPNNMACCAVGRRQFTLFPPEQIDNLYPGPLDPTPGGQVVSLVDFANPDLRALSAVSRGAGARPGQRCWSPAMRSSSPACGGTTCEPGAVQRAGQLLVAQLAGFPVHAHACAAPRACGRCATGPSARSRPGAKCSTTTCSAQATGPASTCPSRPRGVLGPIDENLARRMRAMLIGRLNR